MTHFQVVTSNKDVTDMTLLSFLQEVSKVMVQNKMLEIKQVSVSETCWRIAHKIQPGAIWAFLDCFFVKKKKKEKYSQKVFHVINISFHVVLFISCCSKSILYFCIL